MQKVRFLVEMSNVTEEKDLLPHHRQKPLCTTRLAYRQGRKLTAIKVYTVNTESNHLLIFGVPALNLRRETKELFLEYGNLLQFHVSKEHEGEAFTETFHACYDKIQSARVAKRMLDTKNYYGGILHISYAPEFETLDETRRKLLQRRKDVTYRLKNLKSQKEVEKVEDVVIESKIQPEVYGPIQNEVSLEDETKNVDDHSSLQTVKTDKKLNMGDKNIIYLNKKRKKTPEKIAKKKLKPLESKCKVIDFTSTDKSTISNLNEAINYNKFGNEVIRAVDVKPLNQIKFNKKS